MLQDKIVHPGKNAGKSATPGGSSPNKPASPAAHRHADFAKRAMPSTGTHLAPITSESTLMPPANLALFDEGPQEPFCSGCHKVCIAWCSICILMRAAHHLVEPGASVRVRRHHHPLPRVPGCETVGR